MKPGIEATTDFVFKQLFADEKDSELAIDLINAVVEAPTAQKRARSLTLQNPVEEKEHSQDKQTVYDIRYADQAVRQYLLEMQRQGLWFFPRRALFYACREYARQLRAGEDYVTLQQVYVLCFM